jgi:Fe-S-cluster containining protein
VQLHVSTEHAAGRVAGCLHVQLPVSALTVLQDVAALVVDEHCDCSDTVPSSRCCRFDVTGREPSVTKAEFDVVWAAWRKTGRKARVPDPLGSCPFLVDDRCGVYDARPLGCRTFFCTLSRGYPRKAIQQHVRTLEALSLGTEALPLRTWVKAAKARG